MAIPLPYIIWQSMLSSSPTHPTISRSSSLSIELGKGRGRGSEDRDDTGEREEKRRSKLGSSRSRYICGGGGEKGKERREEEEEEDQRGSGEEQYRLDQHQRRRVFGLAFPPTFPSSFISHKLNTLPSPPSLLLKPTSPNVPMLPKANAQSIISRLP